MLSEPWIRETGAYEPLLRISLHFVVPLPPGFWAVSAEDVRPNPGRRSLCDKVTVVMLFPRIWSTAYSLRTNSRTGGLLRRFMQPGFIALAGFPCIRTIRIGSGSRGQTLERMVRALRTSPGRMASGLEKW